MYWCYTHTQTFTCVCFEEACGISLACSGGVVCDWEEAPRGEWERRESREGRSLDPTWTAGRDAAFSGSGCLPSAQRGKGGERDQGDGWKQKEDKQKREWIRKIMTYKSYSNQEQSRGNRQWSCFILTLSRSSLHTLSGWKCNSPPAGHKGKKT